MLKNYCMVALLFLVISPTYAMQKERDKKTDTSMYLFRLCREYLPDVRFGDLKETKARYAHLIAPKKVVEVTFDDRIDEHLKTISQADCKEIKKEWKKARYYFNLYHEISSYSRIFMLGSIIAGLYVNTHDKLELNKTLGFIIGATLGGSVFSTIYSSIEKSIYSYKVVSLGKKREKRKIIRDILHSDGDDIVIKHTF